ncbi:hypothetical protein Q7P37_002074 [Cladosporium fusiforme]
MGERSSSSNGVAAFPPYRSGSGSWGYHSNNNVLTYPNEQRRSRQIPLAYHNQNNMSYNRTLSPGGRRLTNPARASESSFDPYYSQRHSAYASPRASTDRVIPISSQTYLNPPSITSASSSSTRLTPGFDAYSGRPRRSSMLENTRSGATSNPAPPRNRPTVVQADNTRPSSPPRRDRPDYYIQPASSKEPKPARQFEHKKLYSVDDGSAKLVADVDMAAGGERHHKRRESGDRSGYRGLGYDRGRKPYHANGRRERTLEDEDAFSYTDPASMYKDTEPRWRETRPRRGSVDRGGASRDRSSSMLDPYGTDPRRSAREIGPPPSQRGWDKINDLGRSRSTRDPVPHSPSRARDESRGRHSDNRDPYYVAPRKNSSDRSRNHLRQDQTYDYDYEREPRHERKHSATRHKDRSVSRRGFGIRSESKDRYGTQGSDDSFEASRKRDMARDSGYADGHRRDEPQYAERGSQYPQDSKRREHGRSYEEYDRDSDRERAKKERDHRDEYRERHHHRRNSSRDDRKDGDNSISGAAKIAAGGLASAATLFGLNREKGKKEEREREEQERQREQDRQRDSERPREERRPDDRRDRDNADPERRRRGGGSHDDEPPHQHSEPDRGLGFAFEGPPADAQKSRDATRDSSAAPGAPHEMPPPQPPRPHPRQYDRDPTSDREYERPHDAPYPPPSQAPAANDADEDYRRRMEQVQRELGLPPQEQNSDSDPDRERRRREREIRQAERQGRKANGMGEPTPYYDQPPQPHTGGLRDRFEDDASQATYSTAPTNNSQEPGLRRRASVLDATMDPGLMAQVIDNSQSEKRENRVRIVDPPTDEEDKKPKGILKKPTAVFPEDPNAVREGVAPLKDANKKGIPPGARWTKIDRRLVNPEALEKSNERFEERQDFVIVLRVLTKEEIQKLADRTRDIREAARASEDKHERRASRRRARKDRDEYEDDNSEDEYAPRKPKMLEAPSSAAAQGGASEADFIRGDRERRERERGEGGCLCAKFFGEGVLVM